MESLFVLIPLSVVAMLGVIGVFAWALHAGQFDALEDEGARILERGDEPFDADQYGARAAPQQSTHSGQKARGRTA